MKLSREEEAFLRRWIYDEARYREGPGPAKRLQLAHQAIPADLATIIAAAIPDPADQAAASTVAPTGLLVWPWTEHNFRDRLGEARAILAITAAEKTPGTTAP
jgi:hypothetical protein